MSVKGMRIIILAHRYRGGSTMDILASKEMIPGMIVGMMLAMIMDGVSQIPSLSDHRVIGPLIDHTLIDL